MTKLAPTSRLVIQAVFAQSEELLGAGGVCCSWLGQQGIGQHDAGSQRTWTDAPPLRALFTPTDLLIVKAHPIGAGFLLRYLS